MNNSHLGIGKPEPEVPTDRTFIGVPDSHTVHLITAVAVAAAGLVTAGVRKKTRAPGGRTLDLLQEK